MPYRELLEKYPLYRKYPHCLWNTLDRVDKPTVHMACASCKSDQTFEMINEYHEGFERKNVPVAGLSVRAVYMCVACKMHARYFFLKFGEKSNYVMKVGQEPPWSVAIDRDLARMLGAYADTYHKGLISESQSYGIGAFAYYRRVVEDLIDQLLDEIGALLHGQEHDTYAEALERAKKTRVAQDKIDLVKDLLPPFLRPDGINPLGVLHTVLSEGLHAHSDEDCVALAATTREALVFLVSQVLSHKAASKTFTKNIRKLLEKKK